MAHNYDKRKFGDLFTTKGTNKTTGSHKYDKITDTVFTKDHKQPILGPRY